MNRLGGPIYPAALTALDVPFDSSRDGRIDKVRFEARHVEAEPLGIRNQAITVGRAPVGGGVYAATLLLVRFGPALGLGQTSRS